jgi:hypothetical protein
MIYSFRVIAAVRMKVSIVQINRDLDAGIECNDRRFISAP